MTQRKDPTPKQIADARYQAKIRREIACGSGFGLLSTVNGFYRVGMFDSPEQVEGAFKLAYQQTQDGMGATEAAWMGLSEKEWCAWKGSGTIPEPSARARRAFALTFKEAEANVLNTEEVELVQEALYFAATKDLELSKEQAKKMSVLAERLRKGRSGRRELRNHFIQLEGTKVSTEEPEEGLAKDPSDGSDSCE